MPSPEPGWKWLYESHLMREAIRGHRRQSEAIKGWKWLYESHLMREAIRGHRRQSEAIKGWKWLYESHLMREAIRFDRVRAGVIRQQSARTPCPRELWLIKTHSEVIRGTQHVPHVRENCG